jgi:hypothetical protein
MSNDESKSLSLEDNYSATTTGFTITLISRLCNDKVCQVYLPNFFEQGCFTGHEFTPSLEHVIRVLVVKQDTTQS